LRTGSDFAGPGRTGWPLKKSLQAISSEMA
jgi:hypothetical protein